MALLGRGPLPIILRDSKIHLKTFLIELQIFFSLHNQLILSFFNFCFQLLMFDLHHWQFFIVHLKILFSRVAIQPVNKKILTFKFKLMDSRIAANSELWFSSSETFFWSRSIWILSFWRISSETFGSIFSICWRISVRSVTKITDVGTILKDSDDFPSTTVSHELVRENCPRGLSKLYQRVGDWERKNTNLSNPNHF